MMYRNQEGYADPTAGQAMSRVMREYREQQKSLWRQEHDARNRKKVYVVSRYAGNIDVNVANAIRYCRFVIGQSCMPVASHLLYPQMLDDNDPDQRLLGTMFGLVLLALCREVWVFGSELSPGMRREVREAKRLGKRLRYFDEQCQEVVPWDSQKN